MDLLTLLTTIAKNVHHQISMEELTKDQPSMVREAFMMNSNIQLRNIIGGSEINYPDRDEVVTIVR